MPQQNLIPGGRRPTMFVQRVGDVDIAVRFWNIGGKSQFMALLQRFRSEFLLARAVKLESLDWLIVAEAQYPEVQDFCRRYGLQIEHEV